MEAKKRIDLPKVVADTTASELTKKALALLLPLLSGLVAALVPQVRDRILPALPKPLLAVLVGILLSINFALLFYTLYLRKQRNRAVAENVRLQDLIDNPPFINRFGVRWSRDLTPHCPACAKPLTYTSQGFAEGVGTWGFNCVHCDQFIPLNDDHGRNIELKEAKRLISSNGDESEATPAQARPPDHTIKLIQALDALENLKANLARGDVEERFVNNYNRIISGLREETGYDLTEFSIPPNEVKRRETHHPYQPRIGRLQGTPAHTTYSRERYCNRQVFLIAIDNAMSRLKRTLGSR